MGSLSTRLVLERERQNISLEEISLSTKINIRFLTAIEQGHFEELPGGIICKGFLRAYARQIGMDEEQAINGYLAAIEANQPEGVFEESLQRISGRNHESVAARLPWWTFAVALLIIGFGFIALRHYKRGLMHRDERGSGSVLDQSLPSTSNHRHQTLLQHSDSWRITKSSDYCPGLCQPPTSEARSSAC
jgi:cytoskeleton protein RodZ